MQRAGRSLRAVDDAAHVLDHSRRNPTRRVRLCPLVQLALLVLFVSLLYRLDHLFLREELLEVFLVGPSCGLPQRLRVLVVALVWHSVVKCAAQVLHTGMPIICRQHRPATSICRVAPLEHPKCRPVGLPRVEG